MQKHHLYFLFSLLLITISSVAASTGELPPRPLLDGYSPIKNLSDPHVIEVAKFAVKEHNKQVDPKHKLRFLHLITGYSQVVAGKNWKLVFYARPVHTHRTRDRCVAVVYERPWENFMNLTSFQIVQTRHV